MLNDIPTPPLFPRVVPGAPRLRPVATADERTLRTRGMIARWAKTALCVACEQNVREDSRLDQTMYFEVEDLAIDPCRHDRWAAFWSQKRTNLGDLLYMILYCSRSRQDGMPIRS